MIFLPSLGETYKSEEQLVLFSSWYGLPQVSSNKETALIRKTGLKYQQTPICSPYQANSWQTAATARRPQGRGRVVASKALTQLSWEIALRGFGARTEG